MKRRRSALAAGALLALALALGCGRRQAAASRPPIPPPSAHALQPWTWHPLGGLAVIEGEVPAPTNLVLEGHAIRETRFAETGPVRWELFRPPEGEVAELRTASGQLLARFDFSTSARSAAPPPARIPRTPAPIQRTPEPPRFQAALPPETPSPTVATRTRPESVRLHPLPPSSAPPAWAPRTQPAAPAPGPAWPTLQVEAEPPGQAWPGMGEALNLTRGPRAAKRMLLSFDGGSGAEVATEVLDTLKARGVRTTFFLTGQFIRHHPDLVRRMVAEGHEIGNHTMDHPHFAPGMRRDPAWTKARVQKELLDADAELMRVAGRPMDPYWRAPYGEQTPEIRRWAEELGYRHVGWSEGADTLDWATAKTRHLYRTGPAILARLQKRLDHDGNGIIVLMHLGSERAEPDRPAAGLGAFMDRARAEGWSFVTAGTFLRELGKPAWDPRHRLALLAPQKAHPGAGAR